MRALFHTVFQGPCMLPSQVSTISWLFHCILHTHPLDKGRENVGDHARRFFGAGLQVSYLIPTKSDWPELNPVALPNSETVRQVIPAVEQGGKGQGSDEQLAMSLPLPLVLIAWETVQPELMK